ncbi:PIG-P-domain-containing protein [Tricharina praecox]|uniref:PIG-P-domain-containing protein n=1 Tax=Tricharina praecox TaxID=43433 RepID=UPI00221F2BD9|nr:PIG-P-domain-containing protein [Tricharina praecox]KAI5850686.1 PIG-P-domain-containing protein [Tricharina praecox]
MPRTTTSSLAPPAQSTGLRSPSPRRSPPSLHPSSFAPPFYNRPPTPLPPSPSLTSLLRPSRPTTPDSSDSEGILSSSRLSSRTPRYAPKVPTYEYYGFTLYVIANAAFALQLLWSFLPASFLESLGFSYYPSRWWSLVIPSYLVVLVCYVFVALAGYNTTVLTFPLGALEAVVDVGGNVAAFTVGDGEVEGMLEGEGEVRDHGKSEKWGDMLRGRGDLDWRTLWSRGTDAVMDVPIGGVCEVLYGEGREREEWEVDDDE